MEDGRGKNSPGRPKRPRDGSDADKIKRLEAEVAYLKAENQLLKDVLIHSDQGFHYTNPAYIRKVEKLKMIQSMSRKGNCIDNAPIESFFGHLKDEVDYKRCKTFEELY